jgi:hypothetical protein
VVGRACSSLQAVMYGPSEPGRFGGLIMLLC